MSKAFPGIKALDSVELEIISGEVHALVGKNGAGKPRLIKILAGVKAPDPGVEILIDNQPFEIQQPIDATKKGIAVIYQDFSFFPSLTVAKNIGFGKEIGQGKQFVNWSEVKGIAQNSLKELEANIGLNTPLEKRK